MKSNKHQKNNHGTTFKLKLFFRLVVIGIGLGVISGSTLKTIALKGNGVTDEIFPNWFSSKTQASNNPKSIFQLKSSNQVGKHFLLDKLRSEKEITSLSSKWNLLATRHKALQASAFLLSLDDGRYAEFSSKTILPAASSIKAPILLVVLAMIDSGQLRWNEPLKLTKEVIGGGAGWMAYQPIGKSFPVHEVATEMIRVSDNTATNLLIKRVGGIKALNARFKALGLRSTSVNNFLPDLEGTNTTNVRDLCLTMAMVDEGKTLNMRTRDLFREVMSTSNSNRLLPGGLLEGLGGTNGDPDYNLMIKGYRVYNKTGDIGIAYADAGLIQMPDGRRAVAGFIVKGPFNDPRSTRLIREMAASMAPNLKPNEQSY